VARLKTIDDAELLRVAREAFLENGFEVQATEIAARAGISSGSIFRRFTNKKSLFLEAMKVGPLWPNGLDGFVGQEDLKGSLQEIATDIFFSARQSIPCVMLVWAQRFDGVLQSQDNEVRALASFLNKEIELGRLSPSLNTEIAARTIIGTIYHAVMLELFTGIQVNPEQFIEDLIDTLWKGLLANPESY
jgi:AcrR family transcriptional regulator